MAMDISHHFNGNSSSSINEWASGKKSVEEREDDEEEEENYDENSRDGKFLNYKFMKHKTILVSFFCSAPAAIIIIFLWCCCCYTYARASTVRKGHRLNFLNIKQTNQNSDYCRNFPFLDAFMVLLLLLLFLAHLCLSFIQYIIAGCSLIYSLLCVSEHTLLHIYYERKRILLSITPLPSHAINKYVWLKLNNICITKKSTSRINGSKNALAEAAAAAKSGVYKTFRRWKREDIKKQSSSNEQKAFQ